MSDRGMRAMSESTRVPVNGLSGKKGVIPESSPALQR